MVRPAHALVRWWEPRGSRKRGSQAPWREAHLALGRGWMGPTPEMLRTETFVRAPHPCAPSRPPPAYGREGQLGT